MDGKIIRLTKPVEAFGKTYSEITLREPTGAIFSRLGQPRIAVVNSNAGSGYWVERDEVISAYLDRLVQMDGAESVVVLQQLSLADSISLRAALFSFFDEALAKNAGATSA